MTKAELAAEKEYWHPQFDYLLMVAREGRERAPNAESTERRVTAAAEAAAIVMALSIVQPSD